MSDQRDHDEIDRLQQVNASLNRSLVRCRVLLNECRNKLAANSNDPESDNASEDAESEEERA